VGEWALRAWTWIDPPCAILELIPSAQRLLCLARWLCSIWITVGHNCWIFCPSLQRVTIPSTHLTAFSVGRCSPSGFHRLYSVLAPPIDSFLGENWNVVEIAMFLNHIHSHGSTPMVQGKRHFHNVSVFTKKRIDDKFANRRKSWNQIQTLKECFFCHV